MVSSNYILRISNSKQSFPLRFTLHVCTYIEQYELSPSIERNETIFMMKLIIQNAIRCIQFKFSANEKSSNFRIKFMSFSEFTIGFIIQCIAHLYFKTSIHSAIILYAIYPKKKEFLLSTQRNMHSVCILIQNTYNKFLPSKLCCRFVYCMFLVRAFLPPSSV